MLLISHRGNLFGPDDLLENNPTKVAELVNRGFHVEVDVWSKDGKLYLQSGAGIVHDSVPKSEYEETKNKAQILFKAANITANVNK